MARKSRKNAAAEPIQMPSADRIYKAGLYARISVETERKREADTIGNQLQLLRDYVSEHSDLSVFDIYSDDDISGTGMLLPRARYLAESDADGISVHPGGNPWRSSHSPGVSLRMSFAYCRSGSTTRSVASLACRALCVLAISSLRNSSTRCRAKTACRSQVVIVYARFS